MTLGIEKKRQNINLEWGSLTKTCFFQGGDHWEGHPIASAVAARLQPDEDRKETCSGPRHWTPSVQRKAGTAVRRSPWRLLPALAGPMASNRKGAEEALGLDPLPVSWSTKTADSKKPHAPGAHD